MPSTAPASPYPPQTLESNQPEVAGCLCHASRMCAGSHRIESCRRPKRPGWRAASWSKKRLQVGAHDPLDPAEPCEFDQVIDFGSATFPIQLQRFDDGVLANSVAELEAVGQRLLGAVDSHGEAVDLVGFYPLLECLAATSRRRKSRTRRQGTGPAAGQCSHKASAGS